MSVVLNNPSSFHENLGTFFDPHHHHHHQHGHHHLSPLHHQFPSCGGGGGGGGGDNILFNGKSPRLISASWETLERLPRMSPPTSESITSHLLSNSSSLPSSTAATSTYYDYSFFYKVICTPEFLKSAKENYILPMLDTEFNQIVLPVECGKNCAFMYLTKLCQGSKGPCILFNACYWLTPNEFQSISGRNSAKDWKRSIRHNGKSIKLLINKGILTVHSPLCDCAYGSGIETFVEKHSIASSSPPIIASPTTSLDTRALPYGVVDSECSHSDGGTGGSEDDPDNDENISSSTNSDVCGNENGKDFEKHHHNVSIDEEEKIDVVETKSAMDEEENLQINDAVASSSSQISPYRSVGITAAAESQGEESSSISVSNNNSSKSNGDQSNGSGSERGNGSSGGSATTTPTVHKSKRKPSTKQVHQHKPSAEQQSPTHLSSTTSSPPMTPPPLPLPPPQSSSSSQQSTEAGERGNHGSTRTSGVGGGNAHSNNNGNSGGSSPPQQPIKQMEQMMSASSRNYSEFMRSLAAKYNHQQSNHNNEYFPNLSFDTRFLKPAAAAAFLNLSQLPSPVLLDKDKFPLIDMSSTHTLLSMVRSASAAAAAAAAVNNNNNNNTSNHNNNNNDCFSTKSGSGGGGGIKRPNSPLDLSARDIPPLKKGKLKASSSPLDLMMQNRPSPTMMMAAAAAAGATGQLGQGLSAATVCMSSCASGCSEEAQIMINWTVEEVCQFVASIDLCKDYVEVFRDHSIDGSALPLLTEEHLMTAMNMKLGPALKFRSTVAKRLGNCVVCSHCTHCHNHNNN